MIFFSKQLLTQTSQINKEIYKPQQIISTLTSPNNSKIELLDSGIYELIMVGGAGGSTQRRSGYPIFVMQILCGGSGNAFVGKVKLESGIYDVMVGSVGETPSGSRGGNTTFGTSVVYGGAAAQDTAKIENIITYPIVEVTLNSVGNDPASNGSYGGNMGNYAGVPAFSGSASLYGGYGAGGGWNGGTFTSGTGGYFKLTYIGK